jgi:C4-dicarboxylate-binding protein DctP
MDAQMRALGANPQVLAFSEVYQALQTGVVDGQDNPYSNIYTQKFFEVQKYLTVTDHGYHAYVLIANKKFWDGLPPNIRTIMDGVVKDTTAYFNQIAAQEEADSLAKIKASGRIQIVVLSKEEKAALKKAMAPVYKQVEPRVGKPILESIYKATGSHPDKL